MIARRRDATSDIAMHKVSDRRINASDLDSNQLTGHPLLGTEIGYIETGLAESRVDFVVQAPRM